MANPLQSLIDTGTKLYLDSVEPSEVDKNLSYGAVGATSNPAIISGIVAEGNLDGQIESLLGEGKTDEEIAWALTDQLVSEAEAKFADIHKQTKGDAGWVSFELDPLLEDPSLNLKEDDVVERYVELGKKWAAGHTNRMIKVPATPAGLRALEPLAAAGITLNVTLMFVADQYHAAREAIWRGANGKVDPATFKSVYSIFISRIDVYTEKKLQLSDAAQGLVGLVNAKRIWKENQSFWADKGLALQQELIFASTGTKDPKDPPWKYVQALAGSDIQTNPPETNEAVAQSDLTFSRTVEEMPSQAVLDEIDAAVDPVKMHEFLMAEGIDKFAKPQRALLALIADKRKELSPTS
ncbi:transaldolase family protein [Allorhodopirellula heiligendammensis]|uniref:Transaldolase n=1 Tax=Allorhodopirellula heiligendammensis TaxID=2714739 RepID=A0A5C6BXB2_9BACT|nr:transaldolase family protein [Allorhodopirellula heiligendammensis]TWU16923.1 Transaldolase [Allorhodopirellula heiligendammensis]|tara:strand:- start:498 stop:1553 length:1056 start_codon:yes stop_codon:yes gene_type:complete